jgi:CRP-like cAMP-binding protein
MAKPATDTRAALSRCALFKTIGPEVQTRIAAGVKTVNVRRGERIFNAGERCPGVYLVVRGDVMLSVGNQPGSSKVIDLISTSNHFGLAAAILNAAPVAAHALTDSVLILIPRETLLETAAQHAELSLQLATALSRDVARLTDDIVAYTLHSGRQRVANYLLRIAAANAARSRPFPLPAKKSIIASRLGLTPEYFSRILHDLIVCRAIAVAGHQITIFNPDQLRRAGNTHGAAE